GGCKPPSGVERTVELPWQATLPSSDPRRQQAGGFRAGSAQRDALDLCVDPLALLQIEFVAGTAREAGENAAARSFRTEAEHRDHFISLRLHGHDPRRQDVENGT